MHTITVPGSQLMIRELQPGDEGQVLELMKASEDYFVSATGMPAAPGDAQSLYYSLPAGAAWEDKLLLVAVSGDRTIAVIDVVQRYPGPADYSVGLFLIHPDVRRQGIGTALCAALLDQARWEHARRITATTPAGWEPGEEFLRKQGFTLEESDAIRQVVGNRSAGPHERPVIRACLSLDDDG